MRPHLHPLLLAAAIAASAPAARADTAAAEDLFYEAYYLEVEQGDVAAAAELYARVVASSDAAAPWRTRAQRRLASCREELASADLVKLMPPETLVYAEIGSVGQQLEKLLDMLGLLAGEPGLEAAAAGRRVAVSPLLVRELLGIRGAAVAVTGFDPAHQVPIGVGIFHPGRLDVIRGLLESGLAAGARQVEPIGDHPVYVIEGRVFVCLTSRLVVVSPQRMHIEGVLHRIRGEPGDSLADNASMAEALNRRGSSLLFFCVHARPLVPMLRAMAGADPDFARVQALLDLPSLRWLSGRAGVDGEGLFLDLTVRLKRGHRNLAYNLIRTPPITRGTLACIPEGAAGFFAAALSRPEATYAAAPPPDGGSPAVTGLDLGRELFANIIDFAVYALPPDSGSQERRAVPDIAGVIRVHDPAMSKALWSQLLGIASLFAGAPTPHGGVETIAGEEVHRYAFPSGVEVFFSPAGDKILMACSRQAMLRAGAAARGGGSILDDPTFAAGVGRITEHTSKVLLAHPARLMRVAAPYLHRSEVSEAEPFIQAMTELVVSLVTNESEQTLNLSGAVTGIPDIGPLLARMIQDQEQAQRRALGALGAAGPLDPVASSR